MPKRIVYQDGDGIVKILVPSSELSIEEVARKDVPAGLAYKIVDTSEIPSDRTFRNAWEADMSEPHGTGIGHEAWVTEQAEKEVTA